MPSYKQYTDGEAMMVVGGKQYRYRGAIPWSMSPWAAANLGTAMFELERICKANSPRSAVASQERREVRPHQPGEMAERPRAVQGRA